MYPNEASVRGQLSRRSFLGAVTAGLVSTGSALAQQPAQPAPRVKGPRGSRTDEARANMKLLPPNPALQWTRRKRLAPELRR